MKFRRQDGGREIFLDGKAGLQIGSIHTEVEESVNSRIRERKHEVT